MKYIKKFKLIILYIALIIIFIGTYNRTINLSHYFNNYGISISFETICGECNKLVDGNYCENCGLDEILVVHNSYCLTCASFKDGLYCSDCGNKLGYAKYLNEIPEELQVLNRQNILCKFCAYIALFSGLAIIIFTFILIIEAIDIISRLIGGKKDDNCNNN